MYRISAAFEAQKQSATVTKAVKRLLYIGCLHSLYKHIVYTIVTYWRFQVKLMANIMKERWIRKVREYDGNDRIYKKIQRKNLSGT